MSQSSIEVAFGWKKDDLQQMKKGNPNIFIPGQNPTLDTLPLELQLMIVCEHFSALRVGTRTVKEVWRRRGAGVDPADGQNYLSLALVNHNFYRLCLPLLFEHVVFRYSTSWTQPDLNHIQLSLNISFRVKIINANMDLASSIADWRRIELQNGTCRSFPKLKYMIVSEKESAATIDQVPIFLKPFKGLCEAFEKQNVTVEFYITMLGGSPDIAGFRSKTQRLKFSYVHKTILRLHQAEYVSWSKFDAWNNSIQEVFGDKLTKPVRSRTPSILNYTGRSVHWETSQNPP